MRKKLLSILALLCLTVTSAWAYDQTKSINDGTVTVTAGEHWLITGTGVGTTNKITIGNGATVTLDGVKINASGNDYCIKCVGSATIILKDGSTNTLTIANSFYPALWVGNAGTTLIIKGETAGTGALTVQSGSYNAGIGGGYPNADKTCGDIEIQGGVITATGGTGAAGIGGDNGGNCGKITISGGTVTAIGGNNGAGFGGGSIFSGFGGNCGNITITSDVTSVTATKGSSAPYSIGAGNGGTCGTVTIGGVEGAISDSQYTYAPAPATYDETANLANGAYWSTFYTEAGNYQAPEGTQVFAVNLDGTTLTMTEISDRIVKSGQGVVLKNSATGSITMTLTEEAPAGDFSSNCLKGTMSNITDPGNAYVLNYTAANGLGFYKLSASGTIGANKAYLTYPAAAREFFLFDETKGIEMPTAEVIDTDGVVFDLQGRRVIQPTKGLYIVNGKKVFINK